MHFKIFHRIDSFIVIITIIIRIITINNDYEFMIYKEAATFLAISLEAVRGKASYANWQKKKNN